MGTPKPQLSGNEKLTENTEILYCGFRSMENVRW